MGNLSFFSSRPFIKEDPSLPGVTFLARASGLIRGEQMATYLKAKYNPESGYENDTLIYVKPKYLGGIKDGAYVDIVDGDRGLVEKLQERPGINVIANSEYSYIYLSGYGDLSGKLDNKVILIPEHHCNFEKVRRTRREVTIAGFVGNPSRHAQSIHRKIEKELAKIGLQYLVCWDYKNREDVVEFYKHIDIQVIGFFGLTPPDYPFSHPNKIVNAASFGIPTVAEWKAGYQEFSGNYIPVENMKDMVTALKQLKESYDYWPNKLMRAADRYHISRIAKLYTKL